MGMVRNGHSFGLNVKQAKICRMLAEGFTEDQVCREWFGVTDESTPQQRTKAKTALRRLYKLPGWAECYRSIVHSLAWDLHGRAVKRIAKQMDDNNGWLANKACNDVLTRFGPAVMGENDSQIKVIIEGMPTLGAPPVDVGTEADE